MKLLKEEIEEALKIACIPHKLKVEVREDKEHSRYILHFSKGKGKTALTFFYPLRYIDLYIDGTEALTKAVFYTITRFVKRLEENNK